MKYNNYYDDEPHSYKAINKKLEVSYKEYYKILNKLDSTEFDNRTYVEIPQTTLSGSTVFTNNPDVYTEENYQALDITYLNGTATYTDFNVFAIKVVFFSSNQSVAPQIKALRVTAVI